MHSGHNTAKILYTFTLKLLETSYTLKPSLQKRMFSITSQIIMQLLLRMADSKLL